MEKSRLEILEELAAQDSASTFVRYGLAQEYAGTGRLEDAVAAFQRLIGASPDYTAAYFQCGRTLEKLGRAGEARELYRGGVEAAARSGDDHARSEIQAALELLG